MYDFMMILDNNIFMPEIMIYRIIYRIIFSSFRKIYEESMVTEHKNKINIFHGNTI